MAPVTVLPIRAPPHSLALCHAYPNVRSVYVCKWRSFIQLSSLNAQSAIPQVRPQTLESKNNGGTTVRLPAAGVDQLNLASAMKCHLARALKSPCPVPQSVMHSLDLPYSIRVLAGAHLVVPYSKGYQQECRQHAEAFAYWQLK